MRRRVITGVLGLFAAIGMAAASAEDVRYFGLDEISQSPDFAAARAACLRVKDRGPPAADFPTPAEARALKGCSSEALYYGIGVQADPAKARKCALLEMRAAPDAGDPFAGPGVLMMVYANGPGARRDLDLAIHMACALNTAPVDNDTLVKALVKRKASADRSAFDYCRDVAQGYSNVSLPACLAADARRAAPVRAARLAAVASRLPPAARPAWAAMTRRRDAFIEARRSERSGGAVHRGDGVVFETQILDEQLTLAQRLAAGRGPTATAAARRAAERRLEAGYRAKLADLPTDDPALGAATRADVAAGQRAWTTYRDAWLGLTRLAWSRASLDGVARQMADQRAHMLACIEASEEVMESCENY